MYSVTRYIMRDPSYWKDPNSFNPERFLTKDPKTNKITVAKEDRMVIFGIGNFLLRQHLHQQYSNDCIFFRQAILFGREFG